MKQRIISIDVLRGLTIFFMIIVNTPGSWTYVYSPLRHAEWHGCTPTDLVFPSFLFIVGLSMAISLKKMNSLSKQDTVLKILKRGGMLFLIGVLLNYFPFYHQSIGDLRIFGVLQRIGLAFIGAGLVLVFIKGFRSIITSMAVLLLVHWALLYFFGGNDPYSLEENFNGKLDLLLLPPEHLYHGFGIPFDPEGLLGTLSSIVQVLAGYLIGDYVLKQKPLESKHLVRLATGGVILIIAGQVWGLIYPINKPLWTGSYMLYTTGIFCILLASLSWLIDIKKMQKGLTLFKVFGLNPLSSYILSILLVKLMIYAIKIGDQNGYAWAYTNIFQPVFGNYPGSFLFALTVTMVVWLFALALYVNNKVIRV